MNQIYLLTIGEYEGYTVLGAYEQLSHAEAAMEAINAVPHDQADYISTGALVDVIPMNPPIEMMIQRAYDPFYDIPALRKSDS